MKKKITLLLFTLGIVFILYFLLLPEHEQLATQSSKIKNKVTAVLSGKDQDTVVDEKKDHLAPVIAITMPPIETIRVERFGRELLGEGRTLFANNERALTLINRYNEKWIEVLQEDQLRFHPHDTQVKIVPKQSYIQLEGSDKGRLVEDVLVTTHFPDGKTDTFMAKVDSESGNIIEAYGGRISEGPKARTPLYPSGELQ
ncbi:MAG: hypothetical protein HQK52_08655 [Oligoflexia bacterium]|nr:hypothetical protein [Oligoflexia bacterium]